MTQDTALVGTQTDHVHGNGEQHREELFGWNHATVHRMYGWLIKQGFPEGYQTLCMSCNQSKGRGATCILAHKKDGT
jgi:hypothetical protein